MLEDDDSISVLFCVLLALTFFGQGHACVKEQTGVQRSVFWVRYSLQDQKMVFVAIVVCLLFPTDLENIYATKCT